MGKTPWKNTPILIQNPSFNQLDPNSIPSFIRASKEKKTPSIPSLPLFSERANIGKYRDLMVIQLSTH